MAEIMTYDSLLTDVATYCERSDDPFIAQIPRFVMMAENRIAAEKKPLGSLRTATGMLPGNVLEKPTRWRKTKQFSIIAGSRREALKLRSYEYCRAYWPDETKVDIPTYYADYDMAHFFIAPSPALNYQFELQYYERILPLDANNQTNWLTQYAPNVLLYATLLEAMPFLKTQERIAEFQTLYTQALGAVIAEDQDRMTDGSSSRG